LTRNIPVGLKWLTEFFVDSTTREFLNKMMVDMRKGVERMQGSLLKARKLPFEVVNGDRNPRPSDRFVNGQWTSWQFRTS